MPASAVVVCSAGLGCPDSRSHASRFRPMSDKQQNKACEGNDAEQLKSLVAQQFDPEQRPVEENPVSPTPRRIAFSNFLRSTDHVSRHRLYWPKYGSVSV